MRNVQGILAFPGGDGAASQIYIRQPFDLHVAGKHGDGMTPERIQEFLAVRKVGVAQNFQEHNF